MDSFEAYQAKFQTEKSGETCPAKKTLAILQGKWSGLVLFELTKEQPQRFNTLQKKLPGITNTMLTSTLRSLEKKGLVNRIQLNEIPPHVEYSLTEAGKNLYTVFAAMAKWGMEFG